MGRRRWWVRLERSISATTYRVHSTQTDQVIPISTYTLSRGLLDLTSRTTAEDTPWLQRAKKRLNSYRELVLLHKVKLISRLAGVVSAGLAYLGC